MKIYRKVSELIGNTPLMEFENLEKDLNIKGKILGKLEYFNPGGSIKDRVGLSMIEDFERRGLVNSHTIFIESTSGNTGIGLASICAQRGYRLIIVMPESMSIERRKLIGQYGAEIVLTKASEGMEGANKKALELRDQYENAIIPSQFTNMVNPKIHYESTGPEIYGDTDGQVDIFVSAIGTGGTISGVGKYLKEKNPNIKIVGIEPSKSPTISEGKRGPIRSKE